MKKLNKKGFTLIELMAVVIILIIIIFIAINKINDSSQRTRNNALIANAGSYVKAVNGFIAEEGVNNDDLEFGSYNISELDALGVKVSGTKPTNGAVVFNDGEITYACLEIDGYRLEYKNSEVSNPKTGKCDDAYAIRDFTYSGEGESFVVPKTGRYKIELWGAQGGEGGKGGYTSGEIDLTKGTTLYFYVGGKGPTNATQANEGGYNGGGYSGTNTGVNSFGGGGATDVRLVGGLWNNEVSLRSRIMVAGGGGGSFSGATYTAVPGVGGNLVGGDAGGSYSCTVPGGGKQTTYGSAYNALGRGSFGYACQTNVEGWGGGGGGGYWGGSIGCGRSGGGGSSFISGYTGSVAVVSADSTSPRLSSSNATCAEGTTDITCSYHYSGLIFENGVMKSGSQSMPNHSGKGKVTGNQGNGYAKIYAVYTTPTEPTEPTDPFEQSFSGYEKLTYLEATGSSYLLTNIIPTSTYGFKIVGSSADVSSDQVWLGVGNGSGSRFLLANYSGSIYLGYNNLNYTTYSMSGAVANQTYTISANYKNNKSLIINDTQIATSLPDLTTFSVPISIFAYHNNTTYSHYSHVKLYSLEFTNGSDVIANYVPCKNSQNVSGLCDLVSGHFTQY